MSGRLDNRGDWRPSGGYGGASSSAGRPDIDIGMRVDSMKAQFFDRKAVIDATSTAVRQVLSRFGAFVRTRAKSSIRKRKQVSAPGQPPSSHTGILKKFIFFAYERERQNVVIGPARLGGKAGSIPEILEHGGMSTRFRRVVRIRPRPYMRPAFEIEKAKLPQMWKDSVKA